MTRKDTNYEKGRNAEERTRIFLQEQGLQHILSNYRCYGSEIDLIMSDQDCLVFVEVKFRTNHRYQEGEDSITAQKIKHLRWGAKCFLEQHKDWKRAYPYYRFDFVIWDARDSFPRWYVNALSR